MAGHDISHAVDNDYAEHERTYVRFIGLTKWASIIIPIALLFIGSMTALIPWALTLFLTILLLGTGVTL
ncbi:MAG: aa3-type cytochrome c oxidase subunit IV [Proteobacteria bacterium]|nr:aa3-type cytochrome c oxidase subunit IV [Pseudomonadota bacterium]